MKDDENKPRCCESCGGMVGDDGLALEMPDEEMAESEDMAGPEEHDEKPSFADAIKRRRGGA